MLRLSWAQLYVHIDKAWGTEAQCSNGKLSAKISLCNTMTKNHKKGFRCTHPFSSSKFTLLNLRVGTQNYYSYVCAVLYKGYLLKFLNTTLRCQSPF